MVERNNKAFALKTAKDGNVGPIIENDLFFGI